MSVLGIDVGTSGCKAATFSADGTCLGSAAGEYATLHRRPGWAELDSRQVWRQVKQTIRQVAAQTADDPITVLAVSSMGEAVTPVSADRQILDHCILLSDARGGEYVEPLTEAISPQDFYAISPNIVGPGYTLPRLLWIKEHQRELYDRADRFLLWSDLVAFMLGCEPTATYSLAGRTLLFDVRREDWSDRLLEQTGIGRAKLGRPVAGGSVLGSVSDTLAAELGLERGVKIVAGGHDQCCNALGAGICRPGSAVCGIGTFECLTPVYASLPEAAPMLELGLGIEHHVLPGLYVSLIFNQSGSLVRWFRDTFARADGKLLGAGADLYAALTSEMPAKPTRLLTLPYFEPTGPPWYVTDAAGAILGLGISTTRGQILKSIMECVTFYFVESIHALRKLGIDTSQFIATGGGARSDQWLQIKADIFGVPFVRPKITEASLLGAAILAGAATGVFASPAEGVACFVEQERTFEPDEQRRRIYAERYEQYRQLLPLLRPLLADLSAV